MQMHVSLYHIWDCGLRIAGRIRLDWNFILFPFCFSFLDRNFTRVAEFWCGAGRGSGTTTDAAQGWVREWEHTLPNSVVLRTKIIKKGRKAVANNENE